MRFFGYFDTKMERIMEIVDSFQFIHNGKEVEVRVFKTPDSFELYVYDGEEPVNDFKLSVTFKSLKNIDWDIHSEACNRLVQIAIGEVINGLLERNNASHVKNEEKHKDYI